jgi:hypothetical protein
VKDLASGDSSTVIYNGDDTAAIVSELRGLLEA